MENYRYDGHCHIFTLKYLLKEAKSLLHDVLNGTYPWHDPHTKQLLASTKNWLKIKDFLRQLYELGSASFGSEEENLIFLQNEAKKAYPSDNFRIMPLMMDIFYMLADPLDKGKGIVSTQSLKSVQVDPMEFQEKWDEILKDFTQHVKSKESTQKEKSLIANNSKLEKVLRIIEEERSVKHILQMKSNKSNTFGFYQTEGFCYHLNNLTDLVKKRQGELYPFIAIDPRREGIIKELLSGRFFNGDARFYGVKLYPRMGYHPQCEPMDAVYKYCNDHNLPITFHCGMSGFPPGETWKYAQFGDPVNFEPVVKKYPNLKINFAHLGSSDTSLDWANTIVRLINENDNVYSDLSCYTEMSDLNKIPPLWNSNPKLKERLIFGTDFDVMYFTGFITMQNYYDNFKHVFDNDFDKLMCDNPNRFLNVIN
jgi:predicted TIM-barrel fold metal-dependent hydrolase